MTSEFILAFLFLAQLVFIYFTIRLYSGIIRHLTNVISDLKAFSMGKPEENKGAERWSMPPKVDEDYGVQKEEAEEPEDAEDEF